MNPTTDKAPMWYVTGVVDFEDLPPSPLTVVALDAVTFEVLGKTEVADSCRYTLTVSRGSPVIVIATFKSLAPAMISGPWTPILWRGDDPPP